MLHPIDSLSVDVDNLVASKHPVFVWLSAEIFARHEAIMKSVVRNNCPNGWIVQKFGGTSVGKWPEKVR